MRVKVLFLVLVQATVVKAAAILENALEEKGSDDKRKCPPWDKWETSKCLWPSQPFSSLPKACTALPKIPDIPDVLKQFAESKQLEVYSFVQNIFKIRGAKSACGYCSRKIRCRQRQGGEWKRGCRFLQAKMVDEECEGSNACVIKPILGACPPPIPMPHRRRRPRTVEDGQSLDMQALNSNGLGDQNLEIDSGKNTTQGPPLWHCARNKDGSKCLCCCGWYFPDAKSGKCVSIRKDDFDDQIDDQTWNWSGLMDLDLKPFFLDGPTIDESLIEQIEPPPMEDRPDEGNQDTGRRDVLAQMGAPEGDPIVLATGHQVAAPVTDTVEKKMLKKLGREDNEI